MNINRKFLKYSVIPFVYFTNNLLNSKPQKYSIEEVKKHNNKNDIWVTYKGFVYNITNFIDRHPGGEEKIMLAAGGSLEPYWNIYKQHTNRF